MAAIAVVGVAYFHFKLGLGWIQATYEVVITLSTVGYQRPAVELATEDMAFLAVLIPGGVGTGAYAASLMVSQIVEGDLAQHLGFRKMTKQIGALHGHVVVCGMGSIGRLAARELKEAGREVVCVAQIASPREGLRVFQSIGSAIPLHAGAVAKAVLAFLPDDIKTAVVEGPLAQLTEKTITDPTVLTHDLDEIKARGYAISREETYPGVYGIGAPVFGPGGAITGGIAIAAPLFRMESVSMLDHAQRVVATAQALSQRLGAPGRAT